MSNTLRVLLVEANDADAQALIAEMRKGGYIPEYQCLASFSALRHVLVEQSWDLVLSDYRFSDFTAIELLDLVRELGLDLPVIIVSGTDGEETAVEAMHAGAHDYLLKGRLERLNPAIERELAELELHREHKRAQTALNESEQRFHQLTEAIPEVFWLIDASEQRLIYLSSAFEKIWERPPSLMFDDLNALLDTVHPDDFQRVEAVLEREGWLGFKCEYRIQLPDDEERWISTRSFPIFDQKGRVCRIAGLSLDITERKGLEIETKNLTRALEQSADSVLITDIRCEIIYVNTAFEDMTGYNREEVLGKRPDILKSGLQEKSFYDEMWRNLINGFSYTDIFINRRKDGDIYYEEQTITPVRDEKGDVTHFVSTGKDITDRLRVQERMHRIVHYDAVTGLANRMLLTDRLGQAIKHARRLHSQVGVICIGLDLNELLSDVVGKQQGESLLREVAVRLRGVVGDHATLAHLGSGEFIVLHKKCIAGEELKAVAQNILNVFSKPVTSNGYELFITPSIGISLYPDDGVGIDELLEHAEAAMHEARENGGKHFQFYSGGATQKNIGLTN